jgi:hypothetical protein
VGNGATGEDNMDPRQALIGFRVDELPPGGREGESGVGGKI